MKAALRHLLLLRGLVIVHAPAIGLHNITPCSLVRAFDGLYATFSTNCYCRSVEKFRNIPNLNGKISGIWNQSICINSSFEMVSDILATIRTYLLEPIHI